MNYEVGQRRKAVTVALAIGWLAALSVVVAVALTTRSDFAGTNDAAGWTIVVLTVPVILLAAWRLRDPLIASLTVWVAATASCMSAWSVLHDESSTAALGIVGPGFWGGLIVLVGLVIHERASPAVKRH